MQTNSITHTERLSKDNYKRPSKTKTEELSKEDIEKLLQNYEKKDIQNIPLNSHVRYFKVENGKKLFRYGGFLVNNNDMDKYVILSNGKKTWTVQVKETIFFKKLSQKDIDQKKDDEIAKLKSFIVKQQHHIKKLTNNT